MPVFRGSGGNGGGTSSFAREETLTTYLTSSKKDEKDFKELFKKNSNNQFIYSRSVISKRCFNLNINGHILLNAPAVETTVNYDYNKAIDILEDFKEFISNSLNMRGLLELHFGKNAHGENIDETVSSSHFHFWCDAKQDTTYARQKLGNYLISKGYAQENNVHIQKYSDGEQISAEEKHEISSEYASISDYIINGSILQEDTYVKNDDLAQDEDVESKSSFDELFEEIMKNGNIAIINEEELINKDEPLEEIISDENKNNEDEKISLDKGELNKLEDKTDFNTLFDSIMSKQSINKNKSTNPSKENTSDEKISLDESENFDLSDLSIDEIDAMISQIDKRLK